MCNPKNEHPTVKSEFGTKFYTEEIAAKFPKFFFTMTVCWAVLAGISLLLVRRNPNLISNKKNQEEEAKMLTLADGVKHYKF